MLSGRSLVFYKTQIHIHIPLDAIDPAFAGILPDVELIREKRILVILGQPFVIGQPVHIQPGNKPLGAAVNHGAVSGLFDSGTESRCYIRSGPDRHIIGAGTGRTCILHINDYRVLHIITLNPF